MEDTGAAVASAPRLPADAAAPAAGVAALVAAQREAQSQLSSLELLVVGSAAGALAKTATAPLDRVRLLYQVNPSAAYSLRGALSLAADIARLAGPQDLWRGHMGTLWRVIPFAGVQFLVYDVTHSELENFGPSWMDLQPKVAIIANVPVHAAAGAAAAAVATVATYPLDVLRVRMAADRAATPRYRNYPAAVEEILQREGARGLFRGLTPTLLGIVPYAALSFSAFEVMKRELRDWHGVATDLEVPLLQRLAVGSASGICAQIFAHPMHIVRRRMQVLQGPELGAQGSLAYVNTQEAFKQIRATEGLAGLFKGASLSWVKGPSTVGLAFVVNDALKAFIARRHSVHEGDQYVPLPGNSQNIGGTTKPAVQLTAIESLVCGGVAGALAKTVIAPGDRVKIIYQTDSSRTFSWYDVRRVTGEILNVEGLRGFWRGHGATLLRVVPYSAISYTVFDPYKAKLRRTLPDYGDVAIRFLAGAAAGATATGLTYPLDVLRARMAAHRGREPAHDGYLRAVVQVVRGEGPGALWSGLGATMTGIVPYSGLSFCVFETLKAELRRRQGLESDAAIGTVPRLAAGAFAGLVAQSATYPLDVVRRRLQVHPDKYVSAVHAFRRIFREEGARGFFKGLTMNWVKGPVAISVSFVANDLLRKEAARMYLRDM